MSIGRSSGNLVFSPSNLGGGRIPTPGGSARPLGRLIYRANGSLSLGSWSEHRSMPRAAPDQRRASQGLRREAGHRARSRTHPCRYRFPRRGGDPARPPRLDREALPSDRTVVASGGNPPRRARRRRPAGHPPSRGRRGSRGRSWSGHRRSTPRTAAHARPTPSPRRATPRPPREPPGGYLGDSPPGGDPYALLVLLHRRQGCELRGHGNTRPGSARNLAAGARVRRRAILLCCEQNRTEQNATPESRWRHRRGHLVQDRHV